MLMFNYDLLKDTSFCAPYQKCKVVIDTMCLGHFYCNRFNVFARFQNYWKTETIFSQLSIVKGKFLVWVACFNNRLSCGTVLISANEGRGQASLEQQLVGPFLD